MAQKRWLKTGAIRLTEEQKRVQKEILENNTKEHGDPFYFDKMDDEYSDEEEETQDCEIFVQRDDLWCSHRKYSHLFPTKYVKFCYNVYERISGNLLSGEEVKAKIVQKDQTTDETFMSFSSKFAQVFSTNALNIHSFKYHSLEFILELETSKDCSIATETLKEIFTTDYTFKATSTPSVLNNPKRASLDSEMTTEKLEQTLLELFESTSVMGEVQHLFNKSGVVVNILKCGEDWFWSKHSNELDVEDIHPQGSEIKFCSKTGKVSHRVVYEYLYGTKYRWKCCGAQCKIHPE
jgi:hypothetical protein